MGAEDRESEESGSGDAVRPKSKTHRKQLDGMTGYSQLCFRQPNPLLYCKPNGFQVELKTKCTIGKARVEERSSAFVHLLYWDSSVQAGRPNNSGCEEYLNCPVFPWEYVCLRSFTTVPVYFTRVSPPFPLLVP